MATNTIKKQLIVNYELCFSKKNKTIFYSKINLNTKISCLGVTGEIGSGKSCFLKAIAGVIEPKHCQIIFDKLEFKNTKTKKNIPLHQRKVVYLWQESSLFPHLNVTQNLFFSPFAKNFPQKEYFLKIFKTQKLMGKMPFELSGGEKQKICLLQALFSCPTLLLLDEPFSCLDEQTKNHFIKILLDYQRKYLTTMIFVSHSQEELAKFSSQQISLVNGAITPMRL